MGVEEIAVVSKSVSRSDTEPNHWILGMRTSRDKMLWLELRQADPMANTIVVCRHDSTTSAECVGKLITLRLRKLARVGDILQDMRHKGIFHYRLIDDTHSSNKGMMIRLSRCVPMMRREADP